MKHLLITAITLPAFIFGGMHMAGAQIATSNVAPPPEAEIGKTNQTATINDINIPYEIIFYIEEKYPGHAVIQAAKVMYDGKDAFRLRIDRDDVSTDYEGFYLVFSAKWGLVNEQKIAEPPKPKEAPKLESQTKPDPTPKPEQEAPRGNGGGRGSGGNSRPDTGIQPQPGDTITDTPATQEDTDAAEDSQPEDNAQRAG